MQDGIVELNPGTGGEVMDEQRVGPFPSSPSFRLRSRVVVCGANIGDIAQVKDTKPEIDECGLVVRPVIDPDTLQPIGLPGSIVVESDEVTSVASNIDTTIVNYIVPINTIFYVVGFVGNGNVGANYSLKVNGVKKLGASSTVANLFVDMSFKLAFPIATGGQSVTLNVTHGATGVMADFEGTILGYWI